MLQRDGYMINCAKLEVENGITRTELERRIDFLVGNIHEEIHICLLGLNEQEIPTDYNQQQDLLNGSPIKAQNSDLSMEEFHQKMLKQIVEIFYQTKTKYVSFIPGGFQECHDALQFLNLK